jgi:hypothetical protein
VSPSEGDESANRPDGVSLTVANEFAEVQVRLMQTRNGTRLSIASPKTGNRVELCPLELEALTWQDVATFSAMIGKPFQSLLPDDPPAGDARATVPPEGGG